MRLDDLQTWPTAGLESPLRLPLRRGPAWSSPHLRRLDGDDRFVVRLVPALQLASSDALLATTKALHAELEDFGIGVPPRLYVIGSRHRDGAPQGLIVTRIVTGNPLLDALASGSLDLAEVDRLCCFLVDYFEAKYVRGGGCLSDLKPGQFVYGSIDGDVRLWMVDLDPGYIEVAPTTSDPRQLAALHWRISDIVTVLTAAERLAGHPLRRTRHRIDDVLESQLFADPGLGYRWEALRAAMTMGMAVDGAQWMEEVLRAGT